MTTRSIFPRGQHNTDCPADAEPNCADHTVTSCPVGQFLVPGTSGSDSKCADCADGENFTATVDGALMHGETSCKACTAECPIDRPLKTSSCRKDQDTGCDACTPTQFYNDFLTQCLETAPCGPGTYFSSVYWTRDRSDEQGRTCIPCPDGTFREEEAHRESACTPTRTCGPDER